MIRYFLTVSVIVASLLPSLAHADSECRPTGEQPAVHTANQPTVRDGFIAIEPHGTLGEVVLVDTEGTELPLEPAFDSQTDRTFEVFESPEELEPGSYALRLLHTPYCDDPREVMLPLEVVDEVASPVTVTPVIEAVDAVMYGRESLVIDVEVEGPHEHWLLIEGDYAEFSGSSGADELVAPRHAEVGELSRYFDGPEQVEQVCVRASYLDLAGNRGPTSELCTTDIERRPFSDAGTCSVSRSPSPTWALFVLLGLAAARRRRQG